MENPKKYSNAELKSLTAIASVYDFLKDNHPDSIIADPDGIRPLNDLNIVIQPQWYGAYATDKRNPITPLDFLTNVYNYEERDALEELFPYINSTGKLPAPSCTDNYAAYDYLCGYLGFPKFIADGLILEGMLWNDDYGDIVIASRDYCYAEIYYPAPHGYSAPIEYNTISPTSDESAFWFWEPKIRLVNKTNFPFLPVYVCESIVEAISMALIPCGTPPQPEVYCSVGSGFASARSSAVLKTLESAGVLPVATSKNLKETYPDIGYVFPHNGSWYEDFTEIGWVESDD